MNLLTFESVSKKFGGLKAVDGVTFQVPEKSIFGLIGPNGAGKTTIFNLITGVYPLTSGSLRFSNKNLCGMNTSSIARIGIARTFQNIRLFAQLSVIENVLVACENRRKAHLISSILRTKIFHKDEEEMRHKAFELLKIFDLHHAAESMPTELSYGNQRKLEIARGMMTQPKLLLLDEPAAGMNYGEAEGLKSLIRWIRDQFQITIMLVEHNMQVVMGVCEEIHVLDHGETIAHGTPTEIQQHPKVLAAYLGQVEEES